MTVTFVDFENNLMSLRNELALAHREATAETWDQMRDAVAARWDMVEDLKHIAFAGDAAS